MTDRHGYLPYGMPYGAEALPSDGSEFAVCVRTSSEKVKNAELFCAFPSDDSLTFYVDVPRMLCCSEAVMWLFSDSDGTEKTVCGERLYNDGQYDSWAFRIDTGVAHEGARDTACGLFYYHFVITLPSGTHTVSQNEWGDGTVTDAADGELSRWQLLFYPADTAYPEWPRGGIMYQIFPDRFSRGGDIRIRDDAKFIEDWDNGIPEYPENPGDPLKNNSFFGGTLRGIRDKLDYIASLGVTCIYLNPIFEAYSNHRYDTGDYTKIDLMLGDDAEFSGLCRDAAERGIRIILDGVFNHTGADSVYFNMNGRYGAGGAYNDTSSRYYSWYDFSSYPDMYRSWWGIRVLPAVNTTNADYLEYMTGEKGIVRRWLALGAAGWRLDVADELSEDFIRRLRDAARSEKSDALILGEVWEDASNKISYGKRRSYFDKELDSVMNYPLRNALIRFVCEGDADFIYYAERLLYSHYPKACSDLLMNILGTHDTERILTVLGGAPDADASNDKKAHSRLSLSERALAKKRLMLAWATICALPGVPCIYYGDEAGVEGYGDPFCRMPFPWGGEDREVQDFFRLVNSVRRGEKLFADGYYRATEHDCGLFVFERFDDGRRIVVVANAGADVRDYEFDGCAYGMLSGKTYTGIAQAQPFGCEYFLMGYTEKPDTLTSEIAQERTL